MVYGRFFDQDSQKPQLPVFSSQLKGKVDTTLVKTTSSRVNLNPDGTPITPWTHTHPSHSDSDSVRDCTCTARVVVQWIHYTRTRVVKKNEFFCGPFPSLFHPLGRVLTILSNDSHKFYYQGIWIFRWQLLGRLRKTRFFGGVRPALKSKNLNRKAKLLGFPTSHNGSSGRGEERSCDFRVKKARS